MLNLNNSGLSRRSVLRGLGASLALPFLAGTSSQGLCQLDPDEREYVLNVFEIGFDKMEVLVAKKASGRFLAGKEYWSVQQKMLHAISNATPGTVMTIKGTSHYWPGPKGFTPTFRMQDAVTWGTSEAPPGLSWVYSDERTNNFVCISFNIGKVGRHYHVTSIKWSLAAQRAPLAGTYVFPHDPTYNLSLTNAPRLPSGFSWYSVTVFPGS